MTANECVENLTTAIASAINDSLATAKARQAFSLAGLRVIRMTVSVNVDAEKLAEPAALEQDTAFLTKLGIVPDLTPRGGSSQ